MSSNAQSSTRVTSSPLDDLAQAYVARTYEASFDILREIMTRHDDIVRRLSASKSLLTKDLEASNRHIGVLERELEDTRRLMKIDKAVLKSQVDKSELQYLAIERLKDSLEREKAETVTKLQESQQHSSQLPPGNEPTKKQADEAKRPSLSVNDERTISEVQFEAISKKTAAEKELEACQRQIVKIKNEKSVLELELSVSNRRILELKAQIPNLIERPDRPHSSPDGAFIMSEKTT